MHLRIQILILIVTCCIALVESTFIVPSILEPPKANRIICRDSRIEQQNANIIQNELQNQEQTPYINCVNNAILKISFANLQISTQSSCPLQFLREKDTSYFTCDTNNFANSNVTNVIKLLCDGKEKCVFNFNQLPVLLCIDQNNDIFELPIEFMSVQLTYNCQTPRRRFRPFSNKRYDTKFTQNIKNPLKTLSYNNLHKVF
ncbi:unnamed protein product [Brachionus calyciflorus]|uniref:Uncharacterized protein n=1 Tax=Brachionus calyciflorus TaxID=104777 RepID=A0A813M673_9BILA|nr:unnamed protein product [Brachionus calyciflorus]